MLIIIIMLSKLKDDGKHSQQVFICKLVIRDYRNHAGIKVNSNHV